MIVPLATLEPSAKKVIFLFKDITRTKVSCIPSRCANHWATRAILLSAATTSYTPASPHLPHLWDIPRCRFSVLTGQPSLTRKVKRAPHTGSRTQPSLLHTPSGCGITTAPHALLFSTLQDRLYIRLATELMGFVM